MRSKLLVLLTALIFSLPSLGQVRPAVEKNPVNLSIGGGLDYWRGDWGQIARFGPSAWGSADLWHGVGVNLEGHSMILGGDPAASQYKYFVLEGGAMYTYHHWKKVEPYLKGEEGFASLSFPHTKTATYTHDTRTTWSIGGGVEYQVWRHIWTRLDYTYEGFPNFLSPVTGLHHTLNPAGFALGATYHFR